MTKMETQELISNLFIQAEKYYGKILYLIDLEKRIIRIGYIEKITIKPSETILKKKNRTVTLQYERFVKRIFKLIEKNAKIKFDIVYDSCIYKEKENT